MKNAQEMQRLLRQRTWDKDVVLWLGSEGALRELVDHQIKVKELDLLDLFDENNLPGDDETIRTTLVQALRAKLRGLQPAVGERAVLLVRSTALLARYDVGTQEFYNWFVGDAAMVVLVMDGMPCSSDWARSSECNPEKLQGYFREPDLIKQVFAAKG